MIETVVATPEHLAAMNPRTFDRAWVPKLVAQFPRPTWAFLLDGHPVLVAGMVQLWPGMAEAWAISDERIIEQPVAMMRAIRRGLAHALACYPQRRLQAAVHVDHQQSLKWLAVLGFTDEGLMRCYGADGGDHRRFALINEGAL